MISGALALASFIGGLFCRRLTTAAIVGGGVASLYALLVVIGLWHLLADANLTYLLGALALFCLAILAPAILAALTRRGIGALFHHLKDSPSG